jgi:hypothetical protein
MSRRFRPTDAFVDESIRGQRYLMGCVLVEAKNLASVRNDVEGLVLSGGRVHFHNESRQRRRELLARFATYPMAAFVVVCHRTHGISKFHARDLCLTHIVDRLQADAIPHLVLRVGETTARTTRQFSGYGDRNRRWSGSIVSVPRSRCCGSPTASLGRRGPARSGGS